MRVKARCLALLVFVSVALFPCLPAFASVPDESSDAAASRRRLEILRSPYARSAERRALRSGELFVSFDAGIPAGQRDDLARDFAAFVSALVDRDGWPRPLSARSPLNVLFTAGPGVTASGWDGREPNGTLRSPVILVASAAREKGNAFTTTAVSTKTAATWSRLRSGTGRSHAKYAAMKGRMKKEALSR